MKKFLNFRMDGPIFGLPQVFTDVTNQIADTTSKLVTTQNTNQSTITDSVLTKKILKVTSHLLQGNLDQLEIGLIVGFSCLFFGIFVTFLCFWKCIPGNE